ncbi:archaellin/type IV pilin N-terminal domain-containing protein [Archaeoglobus neptunius]|uniref:archaellin/type IV pilin N-terminal domain-containing protein n=1 Tax=Archaeoglobus neptunius TaxID=2798580 RepID=UPI0019257B6D|nr:archaellin/type IV pilin N-terminal domain-containing protein [Archaeoglobus neptunius]
MRRGVLKIRSDEKGFTGLEAAIVLIAFVVVAAVFSYVMLGAGFYTTQKSKKVVDTGVKQASSSLTLDGQYIYLDCTSAKGGSTGSNGQVGEVYFYVTQTAGGSPVDLNKTSIAITTSSGYKQIFYNETACTPGSGGANCPWWYVNTIGDGDNVVEPNEKYKIVINVTLTDWSNDIGTLNPNDQVTIEVRPPIGAPLAITKTLPPSFTNLTYI